MALSSGEISLATLSELRAGYDSALVRVYRDKLARKPAGKRASEEDVEGRLKQFVELDSWRYTTLPALVRGRAAADGVSNGYVTKDELVRLMDWKLKHGSFRPALMGLIRSNEESLVESTGKGAFDELAEDSRAGRFPEASLQALCKGLRGVGPATASLVLSLAPYTNAPFFSDELYHWLCCRSSNQQGKQPSYKLKYTLKEYKELWDACSKLQARIDELSKEADADVVFSMRDIEKIAFVVGHPESGEPTPGGSKIPSKPHDTVDDESSGIPAPAESGTDVKAETARDLRARKRKRAS